MLAAVTPWEYCYYAEWFARWFDQKCFAEMVPDGGNLVVYDQNCRARDTAIVAYVCV